MLIQQDSDAYAAVLEAMRLPRDANAEKFERRTAVEGAMQQATEVPLETMRRCQQALRGAVVIATSGNRNAATDTAAGVELLLAGLRSAGLNVVHHDEVFPPDASDAVWLRFAGERKLIVLTKDRAIRTRRLERETLFAASVRAVILTAAELRVPKWRRSFSTPFQRS